MLSAGAGAATFAPAGEAAVVVNPATTHAPTKTCFQVLLCMPCLPVERCREHGTLILQCQLFHHASLLSRASRLARQLIATVHQLTRLGDVRFLWEAGTFGEDRNPR